MPLSRTYNIFISHAWKYGDEYERLVNLLKKDPFFSYRNYSAPEYNPLHNLDGSIVSKKYEIREAIDRKISLSSAVIVISGMYANNREWMEYEIESARKYHKPIIAVDPWGSERTPTYIQEAATTTVGWSASSVIEAVYRYA